MILRPTSVLPVNATCKHKHVSQTRHHRAPGRAARAYLFNACVLRDGLPNGLAVAVDEVEDTRGEAGIVDELGHEESGERGVLGRLEDDRAASREGRADLPCHHLHCATARQRWFTGIDYEEVHTGEVPWNDLANDADGLVAGIRELRLRRLDDLTGDLVCPARVVADALDGVGDVGALRPRERLAVVESLECSERLGVLLHEVTELREAA